MTTPEAPKVPGRSTTAKAAEEKVADKVEDAAQETAAKVTGFRARVRAIRNDYDVDTIEKDAKPFLAGAVIVGATIVDPVLGATVAVNRVGRYIQKHHRKAEAQAQQDA